MSYTYTLYIWEYGHLFESSRIYRVVGLKSSKKKVAYLVSAGKADSCYVC